MARATVPAQGGGALGALRKIASSYLFRRIVKALVTIFDNPALDGERVTGWLPDSNPIYLNSPYEDSFTIMMIMDGTLKPVGQ